jgi:hypothetical protein
MTVQVNFESMWRRIADRALRKKRSLNKKATDVIKHTNQYSPDVDVRLSRLATQNRPAKKAE